MEIEQTVELKSDLEAVGVLVDVLHVLHLGVLRSLRLGDGLLDHLDVAILVNDGLAVVDHVLEDQGGSMVVLGLLLGLFVFLLHLLIFGQLVLDGLLFQSFFSLFICDLPHSSSPLGTGFEHVGTTSLGCYRNGYGLEAGAICWIKMWSTYC